MSRVKVVPAWGLHHMETFSAWMVFKGNPPPSQRPSNAKIWCFLSWRNYWTNNQVAADLRDKWCSCHITVMWWWDTAVMISALMVTLRGESIGVSHPPCRVQQILRFYVECLDVLFLILNVKSTCLSFTRGILLHGCQIITFVHYLKDNIR